MGCSTRESRGSYARVELLARVGHAGGVQGAVPVRISDQVLLVVILGVIVRLERANFGGDFAVTGRGHLFLVMLARRLGGGLLLIGRGQDQRAVLGAAIVALSQALRGVVVLPEDPEQVLVAHRRRVEDNPDDLGVTGAAGTHFFVGGVRRVSTGITHRGRPYAFGLPERLLFAPKASQAEHRCLIARRALGFYRSAQRKMALADIVRALRSTGKRL